MLFVAEWLQWKILADDLVTAIKILDRAEISVPFGHVSVRKPQNRSVSYISPHRSERGPESDILVVNLQGKILEGTGNWHGKRGFTFASTGRSQSTGVVHTHSLYVTHGQRPRSDLIPLLYSALPLRFQNVHESGFDQY